MTENDLLALPRSRKVATAQGKKLYFTGKACKHGHICEREDDNGCIECRRIKQRKPAKPYSPPKGLTAFAITAKQEEQKDQFVTGKDQSMSLGLIHYKKGIICKSCGTDLWYCKSDYCVQCQSKIGKRDYQLHYDKRSATKSKYREQNRELIRQRNKDYYKRNMSYMSAKAQRRTRKMELEYKDLSEHEKQLVDSIYAEAIRITIATGVEHEVDHIVPRKSGGKHHPDNLQILTKDANRKKGAKEAS